MIEDIPLYRSPDYLNLAAFYPLATHLGPGQRALVWLQGCRNNCPGCVTPEMQEVVERDWVSVQDLVSLVASLDDCEGVTFIGGEPFLQYRALATFADMIKKVDKTLMIYTGYKYVELIGLQKEEIELILNATDILVDGPYLKEQDHGEMWRGSANQRILFLSERYHEWKWVREARRRETTIHYGEDGKYVILGIPNVNTIRKTGGI